MPVILEDLINRYAFTMSTESLGKIRVWKLEGRFLVLETKIAFKKAGDFDGLRFMKLLVSQYATHLNTEKERKKGESITKEEADKLTKEDGEQIAEEIIKQHTYLFVDRNYPVYTPHPPNEKGEELMEVADTKLDIPRNEGESPSHHLYRLVEALGEREKIASQKATDSIAKTLKNIGEMTSGLGAAVTKSIMPDPRVLLPPPDPQHKTNRILENVQEILSAQKQVNEATAQSIGKLEKRGETWETMFRDSATQSAKQVRFANRVAVISVVVTIIAILITIYFGYKASSNNQPPPQIVAPAPSERPQGETKQ
jgi:hypothetical protein